MLRVLIRQQERDAGKKDVVSPPVQQQGCGILFPSMQLQTELRVPCPAPSCPALPCPQLLAVVLCCTTWWPPFLGDISGKARLS